VVVSQSASSQAEQLIGTWRLVSAVMEDVKSGERLLTWGGEPNGILAITSTGRWIAVQTAEGRKPPHTDAERAAAFRSMLVYSGRYRTEDQKVIITVDIAWDESWTGTEQVRSFRIEGDKLHIEAAPQPYANFDGRTMRAIPVWQREAPSSE